MNPGDFRPVGRDIKRQLARWLLRLAYRLDYQEAEVWAAEVDAKRRIREVYGAIMVRITPPLLHAMNHIVAWVAENKEVLDGRA